MTRGNADAMIDHNAQMQDLRQQISLHFTALVGARARRDAELNERKMGREYNFSADRLAKAEADIALYESEIEKRRAEIAALTKNSGKDA